MLNLGQRLLTDVVSKERVNQPVQGQGGEVFHYVVVFLSFFWRILDVLKKNNQNIILPISYIANSSSSWI